MSDSTPATAAHRDVYRWIVDACFAAGWLTVGAFLGVIGGWWALLAGPVLVVLAVLGGARRRES